MSPASYEIDPSSSPDARVARANALLILWWHEQHAFVLDADLDRFVAVSLPPDTRPSGLSPDGTRIVVTTNRLGSDNAGLYDLATGRVDWYGEETDNSSHAAALSPDGRILAYLCAPTDLPDGHNIAVRRYDITTGQRGTIWSGPGGLAAESALAWSPDGELLAVGMISADDAELVNVLDVNGRRRAGYKNSYIVAAPNAAWFSARELCVVRLRNGFEVRSVDPRRRFRPGRTLGTVRSIPLALGPDRMFVHLPLTTHSVTGGVIRTRFDGTDTEPFVTYPPTAGTRLDILASRMP
jgi:hypothetical protein